MGGRKNGDHNFLIEETLKVSSKSMKDTIRDYLKAEFLVSCVVNDASVVGMGKCKKRLRWGQFKAVLKILIWKINEQKGYMILPENEPHRGFQSLPWDV